MTIHDAARHAADTGAVTAHEISGAAAAAPSGPRVVRVSRSTVAAANAQVNLLNRLGLPVPPEVAKIAALARP